MNPHSDGFADSYKGTLAPLSPHSRSTSGTLSQPFNSSGRNLHATPFSSPVDGSTPTEFLHDKPSQHAGCESVIDSSHTLAAIPANTVPMAILAQQIPSLPNFSEDNSDGRESFDNWLEGVVLVADACRWDNQAKVGNLATRLRCQVKINTDLLMPIPRTFVSSFTSRTHEETEVWTV